MAQTEFVNPIATPYDNITTVHTDTYPYIDSTDVDLSGKTVFIAGASRGLGRAMSISFAQAGTSRIAIGARGDMSELETAMKEAAAKAGKNEPTILRVKLDISDEASVADAAITIEAKFGDLDILLNNAGVMESMAPLGDSKVDDWWRTWNVNVRGPYLAMRAFLPLMMRNHSTTNPAAIINTGSVGAWLTGPNLSAYQTTKLAVLRLTDHVNAEYRDKGILAYCFHPGNSLTDMAGDIMTGAEEEKDWIEKSKWSHSASL